MINPKIGYQISKQVCKHPDDSLRIAQEILETVGPVAIPVALVAGICYGIYWLFQDSKEA